MGEIYFLVVENPNEGVPVYLVKREHGRGPRKSLHRNLLLPFMVLSVSNTKVTEARISDVDGTQPLLDKKITVTDATDQLTLLDVSDNISLNETLDSLVHQQSPADPSHVIPHPHQRSQLTPSALPFIPKLC